MYVMRTNLWNVLVGWPRNGRRQTTSARPRSGPLTSAPRRTRAHRSRRVNLESQDVMNAVGGATIERRTLINRPDDENARCKVSRASVQRKDLSQCVQQSTTHSTFNAISFQQGRTEFFEPQPWTRGVRPLLQHEHHRQRDHSRLSFDNVTMPFGDVVAHPILGGLHCREKRF